MYKCLNKNNYAIFDYIVYIDYFNQVARLRGTALVQKACLRMICLYFGLELLNNIVCLENVIRHRLYSGFSPLNLALFMFQTFFKTPEIYSTTAHCCNKQFPALEATKFILKPNKTPAALYTYIIDKYSKKS